MKYFKNQFLTISMNSFSKFSIKFYIFSFHEIYFFNEQVYIWLKSVVLVSIDKPIKSLEN